MGMGLLRTVSDGFGDCDAGKKNSDEATLGVCVGGPGALTNQLVAIG